MTHDKSHAYLQQGSTNSVGRANALIIERTHLI